MAVVFCDVLGGTFPGSLGQPPPDKGSLSQCWVLTLPASGSCWSRSLVAAAAGTKTSLHLPLPPHLCPHPPPLFPQGRQINMQNRGKCKGIWLLGWVKRINSLWLCDMPYGVLEMGQYWTRSWLGAIWHQAMTWTNIDLAAIRSPWADIKPCIFSGKAHAMNCKQKKYLPNNFGFDKSPFSLGPNELIFCRALYSTTPYVGVLALHGYFADSLS